MALATAKTAQKSSFKQVMALMSFWDWLCLASGLTLLSYYAYLSPLMMGGVILMFAAFYPFLGIPFVTEKGFMVKKVEVKIPYTTWKITIQLWHVLVLAILLYSLIMASPAQAFFLVQLENGLKNAICTAAGGTAGAATGAASCSGAAGSNDPTEFIGNIFAIFRVLVALIVVGGVVAFIVQSQRDQDATGIIKFVGIVLVGVAAIEGLSRFLITV